MTDRPLMTCGHFANAHRTFQDGTPSRPSCVICLCDEVADSPSLEGRVAKCSYCQKSEPTTTRLAFLEYRPDHDTDRYYCGCRGWD